MYTEAVISLSDLYPLALETFGPSPSTNFNETYYDIAQYDLSFFIKQINIAQNN